MVFFYYLKINYEDQLAFFWVKLLGEVDKLLYSITFAVLDVLCMLTNSPCKFRVTLKPKFSSNRGNPHMSSLPCPCLMSEAAASAASAFRVLGSEL